MWAGSALCKIVLHHSVPNSGYCSYKRECGSRFCTALSTSGPTYKCAAKIKRGCTPRTCLFGADVQQSKLDGLVIKLALLKFAEYDLGKEAKSKTFELQQEIDECSKILEDYTSKQTEADLAFNNYAKRVILVAKNDAEAADWIGKAREEHDRKTAEYGESIARIKTNLAALKRRKRNLTRLKEQSICLRLYGYWSSFASSTVANAGAPSIMYAMPKRRLNATTNSNTRWDSQAGSSTTTGTPSHTIRTPIPSLRNNPKGRRHTLSYKFVSLFVLKDNILCIFAFA